LIWQEPGLERIQLFQDRIAITRYTRSGRSERTLALAEMSQVGLVKRKSRDGKVRVQVSMKKGWKTILRVPQPNRWQHRIQALLDGHA